ncbi:Carbohydrate sulfotransferase 11 [Eumeta japonica]|uniref:Carbohydrate sulfotransferase n=1 Tax=Eumeta variegata TaxID=151549 RepID=A0A4C1Z477_EUMVA|nr:Carbohydrate sulfotransferase 11 [Eumeta japonica]
MVLQKRIGRRIIRAFREKPTNESLTHGHDVTFKEFVLLLTSDAPEFTDMAANEHWQPATALCHPCLIRYTLVAGCDRKMGRLTGETPRSYKIKTGSSSFHCWVLSKIKQTMLSALEHHCGGRGARGGTGPLTSTSAPDRNIWIYRDILLYS